LATLDFVVERGSKQGVMGMPVPDRTALKIATLESVVSELRRAAITALDAGHPLVAAEIAGMADRVEARAWPSRWPRPNYPRS